MTFGTRRTPTAAKKTCMACTTAHPLTAFARRARSRDGHCHDCRDCANARRGDCRRADQEISHCRPLRFCRKQEGNQSYLPPEVVVGRGDLRAGIFPRPHRIGAVCDLLIPRDVRITGALPFLRVLRRRRRNQCVREQHRRGAPVDALRRRCCVGASPSHGAASGLKLAVRSIRDAAAASRTTAASATWTAP